VVTRLEELLAEKEELATATARAEEEARITIVNRNL
jgi:hypothetical protein